MASFSFDASQVAPQESFSPIPAGNYTAQVIESEIKPTKSGTGQMLTLRWQVLDGEYKNRIVFDRINIVNQNPTAEQIGQRQLSAVCHAAGVLKLQDTAQLHNKPIKIKVKIRQDAQYGDSNEVSGYDAVTGGVATAIPTQQASAPASNAATPPWQKKAA